MENEIFYPVQKLNENITRYIAQIESSGVVRCIGSGLENEIDLIDIGTHASDVASIDRNPLTGKSQVRLSMAYCQYYWFIADVALKILDRNIIEESCIAYNIGLDDFRMQAEMIKRMPLGLLSMNLSNYPGIDPQKFLSYFHAVDELLEPDFWQQMETEYRHALSIITPGAEIDLKAIQGYDLNTNYHLSVNSIYCYGIAFILLHEMSHHDLGHVGKPNKDGDEKNADMAAFWSIFTDITGEQRISANASILFVFFSYMMLDPALKEDGVHPRDDRRFFAVYDLIKNEHHKYTEIVVRLLDFWAKVNNKTDYPFDLPCTEASVDEIKAYFEEH